MYKHKQFQPGQMATWQQMTDTIKQQIQPKFKDTKMQKKKIWVSESVIAANTEYEERAPFYVLFICYVMKICWVGRLCASRWGSWGLGWGHWVTCPNFTKLACTEASFWIHSLGYAFKHYVMWSIKLLIKN